MTEAGGNERTKSATRFLRMSEVQARTSLGRSTIYRWSAEGRFPAPIQLGGRVARWIEDEVDEWLLKWLEKSRGGSAPPATHN
ncbi:MAG: AlpA family transcriptional regulator [Gemmatimonadota bacterium]|nr:AlpA family transcriptional regulator [Gemmatimonadota bacterium]